MGCEKKNLDQQKSLHENKWSMKKKNEMITSNIQMSLNEKNGV